MARGTVNKVILIGRLGADPEIRYAPSGAPVANFNLATNHVWKNREGNTQEETAWHRIVAWNRLAEIVKEYAKKGHRLYVEGRIRYRDWEDQSGQRRFTTEIIATAIQLLEAAPGRETPTPDVEEPGELSSPEDLDAPADDNVPF